MIGNVWEWTSTKADWGYWGKGGCYYTNKNTARAATCGGDSLNLRWYGNYGFRVVAAASSSPSDL